MLELVVHITVIATTDLPCICAYEFFGSRGSDTRFKKNTRLLAFGLRRSHTRLNPYTPILFSMVLLHFSARTENVRSENYTLKEKYSLVKIRA